MFTLECDRAYLHAHPERKLSADERSRYDQALAERERGMPAQYITGHQEFWGMDLIVTPAVLIPRPETEHVIETVLARVGRAPSPAASCASSMWAPVQDASPWPWPKNCLTRKSTRLIFRPQLWKSHAPMRLATNSNPESTSMKPTCCRGSNRGSVRFCRFQSPLCRRIGSRPGTARSPQTRAAQGGFCWSDRSGSHRAPHPSGSRVVKAGGLAGDGNQRHDCRWCA